MSEHVWTDDRKATLARLWAITSMSSAAIGREMGITKNTVIGQARRCNLPRRPQPGGIKPNSLVTPPTATHSGTGRPFATTAESEALIKRLYAAGHSKSAIAGMQPHGPCVISRILGVRTPIARQVAPPPAPRLVCIAPPKPPAPTPAPTPRREGTYRCEWLDGNAKPYVRCTASHLPGWPYCESHAARAYTHWPRRTAPMEAMA